MLNIFNKEIPMSFQEKSAWVMLIALLTATFLYCGQIVSLSEGGMLLPSPTMPSLIGFTVTIVVIAIAGHIAVAVANPKDANAGEDERTRRITQKAGHISSHVLGMGVLAGLGVFLFTGAGDALFYICFGSLIASHLVEYLLYIIYNRTAFN